MSSILSVIKKVLYVLTALLAGLCLFVIFGTFNINSTVMNSDFHRQLFEKHDIYAKTHTAISSSMEEYMSGMKKAFPEAFEQHEAIFALLQKSITPEMVKTNLDSIRDGLFQYFKGERKFLPDIHLNAMKGEEVMNASIKAAADGNQDLPLQALSKIEKINLSAILLYMNRSDISDTLFEIKFIDYMLYQTPGFLILVLLLLTLIGLYISRKFFHATKWLGTFILTGGIFTLLAGIISFFYAYSVMPKNISPLVISLPLQAETITAYLSDCIIPVATSLTILGAFLLGLSALIFYLPVLLPNIFSKNAFMLKTKGASSRTYRIIKNTVFMFFCLLLLSATFYRVNAIKGDYEENDFSMAISKMKNANTVTQVIAAQDEAIYTLNVKLVDKEDGKSIADTKINVYGKSTVQDKYLNETISTDETGIAKFTLDKGAFRISFDPENFPSQYEMPAAFFYDLKSPGTTIITVNLTEAKKTDQEAWGIAEVEVLDKENKPVQGVELTIEGIVNAPGYPDTVFSVTNSEGIAVFKINQGAYKIAFVEEKFPEQYIIPVPIDAEVSSDSVTRYTIRLADLKNGGG